MNSSLPAFYTPVMLSVFYAGSSALELVSAADCLTPLFAALYLRGQTGAAVAVLLALNFKPHDRENLAERRYEKRLTEEAKAKEEESNS